MLSPESDLARDIRKFPPPQITPLPPPCSSTPCHKQELRSDSCNPQHGQIYPPHYYERNLKDGSKVPLPVGRVWEEDHTTPPYTLPLSSLSWSSAPQVNKNPVPFLKRQHYLQRSTANERLDSMFIPNHRPALPLAPSPSPFSFSFPTFRHRRSHRNSIRASPTHRFRFPHRSLPPLVLEPWIHSHGRAHRHDFRAGGCRD